MADEMTETYIISIPGIRFNLQVNVMDDRIVDEHTRRILEEHFRDFTNYFQRQPFSKFKAFLENQYRSKGATVTKV